MILELVILLLVLPVVTIGLGWPVACRLTLAPVDRLTATLVLSLLGTWLVAWTVYLFSLPLLLLWSLPILGAIGLLTGHRPLREAFQDPIARDTMRAQIVVSLWCLGWLFLVTSYAGGRWTGDWFGHWQRTVFILGQRHDNLLFNGFDPFTSRPPLVNAVVGAFLRDRPPHFASYQLLMTLLGSLAFFPAARLACRFGGPRAISLLAVLCMLNPMFVQNATYAWTKLTAAFFILAALHFFLRTHDSGAPRSADWLFSLALALAILAHYSAAPYALLLAVGWLYLRPKATGGDGGRRTGLTVACGVLVLLTWFGWSQARYGFAGTFLTSTTVTDRAVSPAAQLATMALNLRDTVVPHFLRPIDFSPLQQASVAGWWRDWFFQLYQPNLFFAFGSISWLVLLRELVRGTPDASRQRRLFWILFITGAVLLGVMVHSGRDPWGLAHICLQPLVLLGLALIAARWDSLGRGWQRLLLAGVTLDLCLGIILHIGMQNGAVIRWTANADPATDYSSLLAATDQFNLQTKLANEWVFAGDLPGAAAWLVLIGLGGLLALAVSGTRRNLTASPVTR